MSSLQMVIPPTYSRIGPTSYHEPKRTNVPSHPSETALHSWWCLKPKTSSTKTSTSGPISSAATAPTQHPPGATASHHPTPATPPLVVYIPKHQYVAFSSQPTVSLTTNNTSRDTMISNGYEIATTANGTRSGFENWPQCVARANFSRSLDWTNTPVRKMRQKCFEQYCWNWSVDSGNPSTYDAASRWHESNCESIAGSTGASLKIVFGIALCCVLTFTLRDSVRAIRGECMESLQTQHSIA